MKILKHAFLLCAMFLPCSVVFAQALPPRQSIPGTDSTLKIPVPADANGGNSVWVPNPIPVPSASDLAVQCGIAGVMGAVATPNASCTYSNGLGADPGPFSWQGSYYVTYKGVPLGPDWVITWANCSSAAWACAGYVKTISGADLYNPNSPNRADSVSVTVKYTPTNTTYAPLTYSARVTSVGTTPPGSDFTASCVLVPNFTANAARTSSFTPWTAKCGQGGTITGGTTSWHAEYTAYYKGAVMDPNKFTINWSGGCTPAAGQPWLCIGKTIGIADPTNGSSAGRTDSATVNPVFRLTTSPFYQMNYQASVTATKIVAAPKLTGTWLVMQGCTVRDVLHYAAMCGYAPTSGSFQGTLTYNGATVAVNVPCPQQTNPLSDFCSGGVNVTVGGKTFNVGMWVQGEFKKDGGGGWTSAGTSLDGVNQ